MNIVIFLLLLAAFIVFVKLVPVDDEARIPEMLCRFRADISALESFISENDEEIHQNTLAINELFDENERRGRDIAAANVAIFKLRELVGA
jgi:hypothetical protein